MSVALILESRSGLIEAREGEHKTVGEIDQELAAGRQVAGETDVGVGGERVDADAAGAEKVGCRVVGAKPVHGEVEAIEVQGQGDAIEVFEGLLILAAVQQAQLDRLFGSQHQVAVPVDIEGKRARRDPRSRGRRRRGGRCAAPAAGRDGAGNNGPRHHRAG